MNVEFMITDPNSGQNYFPAVQEGITWTTERRSNPGKLEFTIVRDEIIKFTEGSPVRLKVDSLALPLHRKGVRMNLSRSPPTISYGI